MEVKKIEVKYRIKRPLGKFHTELVEVDLTGDVNVKDNQELRLEIAKAFEQAREYV